MNVEDRLRDALRGTADAIDVGPRELPQPRRRKAVVLGPALAAAAMLAVVVASVLVAARPDGGGMDGAAAAPGPRLFVAAYGGDDSRIEARDARSGEVLGTFRSGGLRTFLAVAATGDGRTYFALSQDIRGRTCRNTQVHRFTVGREGQVGNFSTVLESDESPIAAGRAALAATLDGRRVAYGAPGPDGCGPGGTGIRVVASDAGESWLNEAWGDPRATGVQGLSWTADGRALAVAVETPDSRSSVPLNPVEVRLLRFDGRASMPGPVVRESARLSSLGGGVISPDGRRVIAIGRVRPQDYPELVEISVADGTVRRIHPIRPYPITVPARLRRDSSGEHLLVGLSGTFRIDVGAGEARRLTTEMPADYAW